MAMAWASIVARAQAAMRSTGVNAEAQPTTPALVNALREVVPMALSLSVLMALSQTSLVFDLAQALADAGAQQAGMLYLSHAGVNSVVDAAAAAITPAMVLALEGVAMTGVKPLALAMVEAHQAALVEKALSEKVDAMNVMKKQQVVRAGALQLAALQLAAQQAAEAERIARAQKQSAKLAAKLAVRAQLLIAKEAARAQLVAAKEAARAELVAAEEAAVSLQQLQQLAVSSLPVKAEQSQPRDAEDLGVGVEGGVVKPEPWAPYPAWAAEAAVEAPEAAAVEAPEGTAVEAPEGAVEAPEATAVEAPEAAAMEAPEAGVVEAPGAGVVEAPEGAADGYVGVPEAAAAGSLEAPDAAFMVCVVPPEGSLVALVNAQAAGVVARVAAGAPAALRGAVAARVKVEVQVQVPSRLAGNEFAGRRVQKLFLSMLKRTADGRTRVVSRPLSYGGYVSERRGVEGCFFIVYDDGDSEHMSRNELKVWLVDPPEFQPPCCKRRRGG